MAAHLLTGEPSHTDHRKSLSRLTDSYRAQNSNDELLSGDKCPRKISFGKINGQDKTGLNIASVKTSGLCKDGQILSKESADNPDKIYSECEKNSDYQERAFDSQGNTCGRGASNMKIKCQKENGFVSRPDVERCIVCLKLKNTKRKIRSKCRKEKRSKTSRNMPYSGGFITESPDCSVTDLRSTYSSDNNSEAYSYRRSVSTLGITREYENVMMKTSAESVYFVLPELNMNSSVIEDKAPAVHVSTDKVLFTDTGSEGKVSVLETVDQSSLYEVQLEDDCKMDSRPGIVSSEANEDLIESKVLEQDIITLERDSVALGAKINRKASSSCKFDSSPSRSVCLEVTSCSCSTASISGSDSNIHCRICHCGEEDEVLICPCGCSGSLAHVHQSCLITWMKNSMTEHCELCQRKIRVIKKIKPCYKWQRPKERPYPLVWLLAFIAAVVLNMVSVIKDASRHCISTPCTIFYIVGCLGAVLGSVFMWYCSKRAKRFMKHWIQLNEDWIILERNTGNEALKNWYMDGKEEKQASIVLDQLATVV